MKFKKYLNELAMKEKVGVFYISSDVKRKCPPGFKFDRKQGKCINSVKEKK